MNNGDKCRNIEEQLEKDKCLEKYIPECDDGCSGIWMDSPRCINNKCVAFSNGKKDDSCTKW